MSTNNQLIIIKVNGKFEIHENICVDNEFERSKESLLAVKKKLFDAIKFANKYCDENMVEYGYDIDASIFKDLQK